MMLKLKPQRGTLKREEDLWAFFFFSFPVITICLPPAAVLLKVYPRVLLHLPRLVIRAPVKQTFKRSTD